MKVLFVLLALWIGISLAAPAGRACTGIKLETGDGVFVTGRTLEFGLFFETSVVVVPRGYEFTGKTTLGDGKRWQAKYASVGSFYFPGYAEYSLTTRENQSISLSSSDITQWIVSQFATVEEVRAAFENNEVAISPILTPGRPPFSAPRPCPRKMPKRASFRSSTF